MFFTIINQSGDAGDFDFIFGSVFHFGENFFYFVGFFEPANFLEVFVGGTKFFEEVFEFCFCFVVAEGSEVTLGELTGVGFASEDFVNKF